MKDRVEALGELAGETLERLVQEMLERKTGGYLVQRSRPRLEFELPIMIDGSADDRAGFARRLVRAIDALLDDAVEQAAVFRPGHAYCHRCRSASCEHGEPPGCRHVFVGYAPTGQPRWSDFAQHCLDLAHPSTDRLFEDPPAFLTLVQPGAELHGGLLDAFRHGAYELVGQVVAGFFPIRVRAEEGRGVLALTAQAVMMRPRRGPARFALNLLGRAPGGGELDRLWERLDDLPWRKSIRWAQSALETLRAHGPRGRSVSSAAALEQRVNGILRGLARRLERDHRARKRRTRHAEQRHASGQRPTRKAMDDARAVAEDALKVDERRGTLVVLGDRGRTHFFAPEGRLVSSVKYGKDAVERKLKSGAWRAASAEEHAAFLQRIG